MKKLIIYSLCFAIVLQNTFASSAFAQSEGLDIAKNLNTKANEYHQSGLELLRARSFIERDGSAEVSRKLMDTIDTDSRLNDLNSVLKTGSIRHESAKKVRLTIQRRNRQAVLVALDKATVQEFETMAAYRVNYVRALQAINSESSKALLDAEIKRMTDERKLLETALTSEENIKAMFRALGYVGVLISAAGIYVAATMFATAAIMTGIMGGLGGLGTLFYSESRIHSTVQKDIELAEKRIMFMAKEQEKVNAELNKLLLINP